MDQLSAEEQAEVKKMSSDRIKLLLARAGADVEELTTADRPALLELMAQSMLNRAPEAAASEIANDNGRHLQLLQRQIELQEAELQFRREVAEEEHRWRQRQYELEQRKQESNAVRQQSLAARIKFYGDALKLSTIKMTDEPGDLPHFFTSLQNVFDMYEVPSDLRAKLTLPLLTTKAKTLLARLPVDKMSDFAELRKFLLSEFRLTAEQYRERFLNAKHKPDETFTLLCSRLHSLFSYYLTSRKVGKDFDKLVSLMVADRLKEEMPAACLRHVLGIETSGDCLSCDKLAEVADVYMHSHLASGTPRLLASHSGTHSASSVETSVNQPSVVSGTGRGRASVNTGKACYQCGSHNHLVSFHKRNASGPNAIGATGAMRVGQHAKGLPSANVSKCVVQSAHPVVDVDDDDEKWIYAVDPLSIACDDRVDTCVNACDVVCSPDVRETPLLLQKSKMRYRDVMIQDTGGSHVALEDSGAEVCIIREDLVRDLDVPQLGRIRIRGVVGDSVEADLVRLNIKPASDVVSIDENCVEYSHNIAPSIPVIFAVSNKMISGQDIILTADAVEQLNQLNDYDACVQLAATTSVAGTDSDDTVNLAKTDQILVTSSASNAKTQESASSDSLELADTDTLYQEQIDDSTLSSWWKLAKEKKGNFFTKNKLLYHHEKFLGHDIEQLCLPVSRIAPVLKLGHDAHFSGHYAYKTTMKRIRLSFYFPNMTQKIKDYCTSCHDCQMRARELVKDRTPITPIPRNEIPFAHLWWDCIGPLLDPVECKGRPNYCLIICDSATRYVFGFPLKRITAEAVCDCLIQVFMLVGVASFVSGDCGSNFRAELTRECLKRLGCSPRFNTPLHPSASGQVERMNQTFKRGLHFVMKQYPKTWPRYVPYILWAMREATNATTGLSPYHLALGRPARGPLAILKENWTGEEPLPLNLGKSTVAFLEELKDKLQVANDFADEHCRQAQKRYAHNYNLRSTDRKFDVGQQVIVLLPDGQRRHILSRWQGPAIVIERKSPYSYVVELDGQKRHLHADRLKAYNARINSLTVQHCAIVDERDAIFGELSVMPEMTPQSTSHSLRPSDRIDPAALSHLTAEHRIELLALLDDFPDLFFDIPGLCSLVMHEIRVTDDFRPKRFQAYRLPESLKVEVGRQIRELLDLGFIKPSKSPMVSPVVCVLKKSEGGKPPAVRLTVDYRYLNRYTIGEMVPTPAVEEMIHRIGQGNFITTADIRSSYWQIPIKPEDTWLTAFVTDFGVYEWVRAPFGLKWSGNSLIRATQIILSPLRDFADSYVDDMSVFSDTWMNHISHFRSFLLAVRSSGMTLNLKKCRFALPQVVFLGHVIGSGEHGPDPEKVRAVENLQAPKTKSDLRKILGFFSYFRMYLPNCACIARPLTDLTGKNKPNVLEWSQECQIALDRLKSMLSHVVKLHVVQYGKPFGLSVDASKTAVANCLFQWSEDGTVKPIAFASLKLTSSQQAWAIIEAEAFAVIWSLRKYYNLTFGSRIVVYSDHNPLTYITEGVTKSAKLMRWSLALQEYDIEFKYCPGNKNVVADCLSRLCDDN